MAKKISAVIVCAAILCALLCSCVGQQRVVLTISGAEIRKEIFVYYLDQTVARPAAYGLTEDSSAEEFASAAVELCTRYVAANSRFERNGLTLTAAEKTSIAQSVNNLWVRYENHYKKIGVSRRTVSKAETAKAYEEKLFTFFYDVGADNAAAESEITDYYYSNYVVFKAVCVYFTASDGVTPMTQLQKTQLTETLGKLTAKYGESKDFDAAATEFGYASSSSSLLKRGSSGYPDGFFEEIVAMQEGAAKVIEYNDCAFAVLRESLKDKGEEYYSAYRSECLKELYAPIAEQDIANETGTYTVERKDAEISLILRGIDKLG